MAMSFALRPNLLSIPLTNGLVTASVIVHGLSYYFMNIPSQNAHVKGPPVAYKYRHPTITSTAAAMGTSNILLYALFALILTLTGLSIGHLVMQKHLSIAPTGPPNSPTPSRDPPNSSTPSREPRNVPDDRRGAHPRQGGGPPPPPPPFLATDSNLPKRPRNFFWILILAVAMLFMILWKQLYRRDRSAPCAASKCPSSRLPELHRGRVVSRPNSSPVSPHNPLAPLLEIKLLPLEKKLPSLKSKPSSLKIKPPPSPNPYPFPPPFLHMLSSESLPPPWSAALQRCTTFWGKVFARPDIPMTVRIATQAIVNLIFILIPEGMCFIGRYILRMSKNIEFALLDYLMSGKYNSATVFWACYHLVIIVSALYPLLVLLAPFGRLALYLADWCFTPWKRYGLYDVIVRRLQTYEPESD